MADQKISELTAITGANTADDDLLVIVDTSTGETKKITLAELEAGIARGDMTFGDNQKAIFGAGSDLQIYHDGSMNYIDDAGNGDLRIRASNDINFRNYSNDTTVMNLSLNNGLEYVQLYYAGSQRLATTATGIDVTGTATMDGLTVDGGGSNVTVSLTPSTTFSTTVDFTNAASAFQIVSFGSGSASADNFRIRDDGQSRLNIAGNGDISFYEDTGTTAKFFWDASAESLGIGTASPSEELHVSAGQATVKVSSQTTSAGNEAAILLEHAGNNTYKIAGGSNLIFSSDNGANERVRIDNAGNVGIGTASPDYKLHVAGTNGQMLLESAATGFSELYFGDSTTNTAGALSYNHNDDSLKINVNSAERMRITSAGNVGIGVTPPSTVAGTYKGLYVGDNSIKGADGSFDFTLAQNADIGNNYINTSTASRYTQSAGSHIWDNAVSGTAGTAITWAERMRLDASGNLLVGKSTTTFGTAGTNIKADGEIQVTKASKVLSLNRLSTDGDIVQFYKDGTTVGSIGTYFGDMYLFSPSATDSGLRLGNSTVTPCTSTGSNRDAAIDLGTSIGRFKNLYLSGGVYVGGTGAANYLDDYEEGTFTPTLTGQSTNFSSITYGTREGRYIKIGNVVHVNIRLDVATVSGGAGNVLISNLPFAAGGASVTQGLTIHRMGSWGTAFSGPISGGVISGQTNCYIYHGATNGGIQTVSTSAAAAGATITLTGTYEV